MIAHERVGPLRTDGSEEIVDVRTRDRDRTLPSVELLMLGKCTRVEGGHVVGTGVESECVPKDTLARQDGETWSSVSGRSDRRVVERVVKEGSGHGWGLGIVIEPNLQAPLRLFTCLAQRGTVPSLPELPHTVGRADSTEIEGFSLCGSGDVDLNIWRDGERRAGAKGGERV